MYSISCMHYILCSVYHGMLLYCHVFCMALYSNVGIVFYVLYCIVRIVCTVCIVSIFGMCCMCSLVRYVLYVL